MEVDQLWDLGLKSYRENPSLYKVEKDNQVEDKQKDTSSNDNEEDEGEDGDELDDLDIDNKSDKSDDENNMSSFDRSNLLHRKIINQAYLTRQEQLIETAEYFYKRGIKKDFANYLDKTMLALAIENNNFKLAEWLIDKKISEPSEDDFSFEETDLYSDAKIFTFNLVKEGIE